jgi:hypothetical protein
LDSVQNLQKSLTFNFLTAFRLETMLYLFCTVISVADLWHMVPAKSGENISRWQNISAVRIFFLEDVCSAAK